MLDLIQSATRHQLGAALMMLRSSIDACEPQNWARPVGKFAFWHVAYHTLYCTDLYLSPSEQAFKPQPFHREGYQSFGRDVDSGKPVKADQPYDKSTLLTYTDFCIAKTDQIVMNESESVLRGPSGFSWLEFPRVGVHQYNIRHVQHHAGQLSAFLNREQGAATKWVRAHEPA